ncbi:hypothetical protein Goarm_000883 [Gossypium armourianum]|uniref:Uncharacterized protein n=1 Tax=Gossypium armourianum TaxID=34283 RepID=A0A7J9KBF4_9ROSI|nr:hypothetical protein [Gossypium armourianum]
MRRSTSFTPRGLRMSSLKPTISGPSPTSSAAKKLLRKP